MSNTNNVNSSVNSAKFDLPPALAADVKQRLETARTENWVSRLWQGDASLWTGNDEANWVGWLAAGQGKQVDAAALTKFGAEIAAAGFTDAVLLGMGGSSLGPEVLAVTLGAQPGAPALHVLDSTDAAQIATMQARIDIAHTLFIVSSKSGSTLEPEILSAYFHAAVVKAVGEEKAGAQFIAVTDPGSKLETAAKAAKYRAIFYGDPAIGGRDSVLSVFGMAPLAVTGHDIGKFVAATQPMVLACGANVAPEQNPGVYLGAVIGAAVNAGRDKLTVFASPKIATIGAWLEQLLAESTGKQGKGIVPVDREPIGEPGVYGDDRLFVYLKVAGDTADALDHGVSALAAGGQPVVRITLASPDLIGQEFFRWEIATAIAGAVIGINPFDQPDVEASKLKTRALTDAYEKEGALAEEIPFAEDGDLAFYGDASLQCTDDANERDGVTVAALKAHLLRIQPHDYAAVLAYIERNDAHQALLAQMRLALRDGRHVATVGGFGPRFLHSTGQAYKGGPNSGVFLQITAEPKTDLAIPGHRYSFGVVQAAQARGDLEVLTERKRRTLRIHIRHGTIEAGLAKIAAALDAALA